MGKKVRVQMIGSFLDNLIKYFKFSDIIVEDIIQSCNPLAMMGKQDMTYFNLCDDINMPMVGLLNIRKNLNQMLSHDAENFTQNYNLQPLGREVREKNTAEYFIFMNSSTEIPLFEKNGMVYSDSSPINGITAALYKDKSYIKRVFPFGGDFNWKYYYDLFIDAVKKEFDKDHIILIKSNCANWYMDKNIISQFDKNSSDFRHLISEMDQYFIEKVGCMVIDEHYSFIPPMNIKCWFPYIRVGQYAWKNIADQIKDIISFQNKQVYKPFMPIYSSELSKFLQLKLNKRILAENLESINIINKLWHTIDDVKHNKDCNDEKFLVELSRLKQFIDPTKDYTLSDYIRETDEGKTTFDLELLELYTRYFQLDINDIIAIYFFYQKFGKSENFYNTIKNVLDADCIPIRSAKRLLMSNIDVLKEYKYIDNKFKRAPKTESVYIYLENNCWFVIDLESDELIKKVDYLIRESVDFKSVIAKGYACSIEYADALTYCYDYYVEKARQNCGSVPTILKFDSEEKYYESLKYIDYRSLLNNERFVFDINNTIPQDCEDYRAITDLSILMDPDLVNIRITSGLCDQFAYYVMGCLIEDYSGRKVIYDDHCTLFNGLEVTKFAKRPMTLLSSSLSERLKYSEDTFNKIYLKINPKMIYMTTMTARDVYKQTTTVIARKFEHLIDLKLPYSYIHAIVHSQNWRELYNFNIRDLVKFPDLEKQNHIDIYNKMLSCDAVTIHVRRGDYLTDFKNTNRGANYNFYAESIDKLLKIPDYPNKKYFVFSDDLAWCKTHLIELGLDKVGDSEIIFVEGNKYEESFRDIQLMSNGKIMIGGCSGFFCFASLYSDRCEVFMGSSGSLRNIIKNKYDVGKYANNYIVNFPSSPEEKSTVTKANNAGGG